MKSDKSIHPNQTESMRGMGGEGDGVDIVGHPESYRQSKARNQVDRQCLGLGYCFRGGFSGHLFVLLLLHLLLLETSCFCQNQSALIVGLIRLCAVVGAYERSDAEEEGEWWSGQGCLRIPFFFLFFGRIEPIGFGLLALYLSRTVIIIGLFFLFAHGKLRL